MFEIYCEDSNDFKALAPCLYDCTLRRITEKKMAKNGKEMFYSAIVKERYTGKGFL